MVLAHMPVSVNNLHLSFHRSPPWQNTVSFLPILLVQFPFSAPVPRTEFTGGNLQRLADHCPISAADLERTICDMQEPAKRAALTSSGLRMFNMLPLALGAIPSQHLEPARPGIRLCSAANLAKRAVTLLQPDAWRDRTYVAADFIQVSTLQVGDSLEATGKPI